jgi:hypothetical protein
MVLAARFVVHKSAAKERVPEGSRISMPLELPAAPWKYRSPEGIGETEERTLLYEVAGVVLQFQSAMQLSFAASTGHVDGTE